MPLVVTVILCGIFYSKSGVNPCSSFAVTIMLSFAITSQSVHSMQKQEVLERQILTLQGRGNELLYYVSRLFLFLLRDLFLSFPILLIPCLFYLISGAALTLHLICVDMLLRYSNLHVNASLCDGIMITLLHLRIASNQRLALPLTRMLIIATMTSPALLQGTQLPEVFVCVSLSVSDISIRSTKWTRVPIRETGIHTLQMSFYAAVYTIVQV